MTRIRTPVYTTAELKQALVVEAERQDRSESWIINAALEAYINTNTPPNPEGDLSDYLTGVTPQPTPMLDALKRKENAK